MRMDGKSAEKSLNKSVKRLSDRPYDNTGKGSYQGDAQNKVAGDAENKAAAAAENKVAYEFNIAGLPFKLRSSHDQETVQELVRLVDHKIHQALNATKSGSVQSAAVLAALNLAEELVLLKRRALKELDRLEERTLKISQDLENTRAQSQTSN